MLFEATEVVVTATKGNENNAHDMICFENEVLIQATTLMNLDNVLLSERSQTPKARARILLWSEKFRFRSRVFGVCSPLAKDSLHWPDFVPLCTVPQLLWDFLK